MKKLFLGIALFLLVIIIGVFAISAEAGGSSSQNTGNTSLSLGPQVSGFIQNFVSKRGINSQDIQGVGQVDFNSLPKEVNIKNVGSNNLAIYQVNYSQNNKTKQVYVVAYSLEQLKSQGDLIVAQDNRNFLNFGYPGVMNQPGFLDTATGVETSDSKGYVMVRDGSLTGISTNLEVVQANSGGQINIVILKNGQPINFGNTFNADTVVS